jgi:hypothetical protein
MVRGAHKELSMVRTVVALALVALLNPAARVFAADDVKAPSPAVAAAWAKEAKASRGKAVTTLMATYGVMQGLDMASTIAARNRGAVEANPMMQGSYAKGMAMKAGMTAVTMFAVRAIEKKHKKAAIVTMIAANVATAMVVANNVRNAEHLRK